jgi:beta-1,4-mannosyl-glycoprotein beta-1,4-N-acetylglucosaminyltransferase
VILDLFLFHDEVDIARIRLHALESFVDYFYVGEFNTTFSGKDKNYNFEKLFVTLPISLKQKVRYFQLSQKSISANPFHNDDIQKNAFVDTVIPHITRDDYIIIGDCDEIPSPKAIKRSILLLSKGTELCHLAQRSFFGYVNYEERTHLILSAVGEYKHVLRRRWIGTCVTKLPTLENLRFSGLRNSGSKTIGKRIKNGGWHFSSCNGEGLFLEERVALKYSASAHQEVVSSGELIEINEKIKRREDPLNRSPKTRRRWEPRKAKFKVIEIQGDLPSWLVDNSHHFPHLILRHD